MITLPPERSAGTRYANVLPVPVPASATRTERSSIAEAGYTVPTPIQLKAIPLVLAGSDLLAAAQTGTGKTAGFVLPILQRLYVTSETAPARKAGQPRCLIVTPTRELAAQVEESVR